MSKECLNCHSKMEGSDSFCPKCGQKDQQHIVPLMVLIGDGFANIFNLDSRIFRTIGNLFIPGKLTLEWYKGKRVDYFSPFRILLITLLILLAYVNLIYPDFTNIGDVFSSQDTHHHIAVDSLQNLYEQREQELATAFPDIPATEMRRLKDSILPGGLDHINVDMHFTMFDEYTFRIGKGEDPANTEIPVKDIVYRPLEEIGSDLQDTTSWLNITFLRQIIKLLRSPSDFAAATISNLVWMVILMLPIVGLVLLPLYWRRGYYYVQHLVFLYHVSSFQVIAFTFGLILSTWFGALAIPISIVAGLIYHFLAFRKVYHDKWLGSLLKYTVFSIWEILIVMVAFLVYVLVTMVIF